MSSAKTEFTRAARPSAPGSPPIQEDGLSFPVSFSTCMDYGYMPRHNWVPTGGNHRLTATLHWRRAGCGALGLGGICREKS